VSEGTYDRTDPRGEPGGLLPEMPNFPGALCKGEDPELWFPVEGIGTAPANAKRARLAVAICEECPHQADCADYALTNRIEEGVWGGLTEADRQTIWAQDEQEAVA
jgi:WhiB family transcriptional regulator, redox-sensing transcriptional regulator